jgi:dipeptidyl aminopeptidase/acylaminoacyl peptidase
MIGGAVRDNRPSPDRACAPNEAGFVSRNRGRAKDKEEAVRRRLTVIVAIVVSIASVALAVSCGSGSPEASASRAPNLHGKILFIREGEFNGKLTVLTAAANGTHVRQLSDFGDGPRFSPDGAKVMMAGPTPEGQRITAGIVHSDGSHLQTIPLRDPSLNLGVGAWSPDGKQMALEGWDDSKPDRNGVYLVGVPDGRGLTRLTKHPDHDIPTDFSPDGSQIVFLRAEPDTDPVTGSLYVMNVDGTGLHRITPPAIDVGAQARWSPNGKEIVFSGPATEPQGSIRVVHPDGSGLQKIFEDPKGGTATAPTWSPDGHKIMFALIKKAALHTPGLQPNKLCVIDEDGKGFTVVLNTPYYKAGPDWVDPEG